MENLNIKALIHAVRQELIESEEERIQKNLLPLFKVDSLKIEVNFIVEEKTETGGGLNLKIVDIGRDLTYSNQQIHKITLDLKTYFNDIDKEKDGNFVSGGKYQLAGKKKIDVSGKSPLDHFPDELPI
ncbi:MAG: hypothetical protein JJU28_17510 [Cyclobacteriaceae bacterium]|nr:hypothetical protein [Cyclobacteriaceae bacterium]